MKTKKMVLKDERGYVLVTALMILVILTFLGIASLNTTTFELQISGNDRMAKDAFFRADGGSEAGIELIEQNVSCPAGFSINQIAGVDIIERTFAYNKFPKDVHGVPAGWDDDQALNALPSDTIRSIRIPADPAQRNDTSPHTNLAAWGSTQYQQGSAMQMVAGYEGKGKGAAAGGVAIIYNLHSQYTGMRNSESIVEILWKHVIGQEGVCNY